MRDPPDRHSQSQSLPATPDHPRSDTGGRGGRSLSLARFLVAECVVIAACLAAMVVVVIANLRSGEFYMERCAAAQQQLALATRLEADVGALMLVRAAGADDAREIAAVQDGMRAFRAATAHEAQLVARMGDGTDMAGMADGDMAEEDRSARRLNGLATAIELPASRGGPSLAALREEVRRIARREQGEIDAAARDMNAMQASSTRSAIAFFVVIFAIAAAAAFALWRMIVRPIQRLADATRDFRAGTTAVRVIPSGIRELRQLGGLFNVMAADVEALVRDRTRELEEKNAALAEIDRSRRLFFAKISHELRTPLTVMLGEADVTLRARRPDPADAAAVIADRDAAREALGHIAANGGYLNRRLDDLIATARSDDGLIQLERHDVDLAEIVRAAAATAAGFAASTGVALDTRLPDASVRVAGDARWLGQALLAMIDNGVKFAAGEGRVTIALEPAGAEAHDRARITISDDGPGVAADEVDRLFDPWFQGAAGRSHGGSGLGLALADWIVRRHDGTLRATPRAEGGLTIVLTLPVLAGAATQ